MKKLDPTSVLAAAVIVLALVLDDLPLMLRVGVVIGALLVLVSVTPTRRLDPGSLETSLRTRLDIEVADSRRLADLVDREIGRAQRFDHEVAVVSLPLHDDDDDVVAALGSVRSVVRNHDLIVYDAEIHSCCVVAVVPGQEEGRTIATKVINVRAVDGSRARTCFYPENGSTADELMAPIMAWRSPITRREAV